MDAGKWGAWATRECNVTMGNGVFEQEYWHVGDEDDDDEVPLTPELPSDACTHSVAANRPTARCWLIGWSGAADRGRLPKLQSVQGSGRREER